MAAIPSLLIDPAYRSGFAAPAGWKPRPLAQRLREERLAATPPPGAGPAGYVEPAAPLSGPPPDQAPPAIPRGMGAGGPMGYVAPVAKISGPPMMETPAQVLERLNRETPQRSGLFMDGPAAGMENWDPRIKVPASSTSMEAFLAAIQPAPAASAGAPVATAGAAREWHPGMMDRPASAVGPFPWQTAAGLAPGGAPAGGGAKEWHPGMMDRPAGGGASFNPLPSEPPPGWDPVTRTLRQTTPIPARKPAVAAPPMDPGAFASEAARRAVLEGKDPIEARKMAEAIRPPASRVGQTRLIDGESYVFTQEGNLSPVKTEKPAVRSVEVGGGRKLTVGPGDKYFDEKGQPVDFSQEKPMSATDWLISGQKPEGYQAYREAHARATAPAGPGSASGAVDLSKPITAEQAAKLPKGTKFIGANGKTYTKQ